MAEKVKGCKLLEENTFFFFLNFQEQSRNYVKIYNRRIFEKKLQLLQIRWQISRLEIISRKFIVAVLSIRKN